MNIHQNARVTPVQRREIVLAVIGGSMSRQAAAAAWRVSLRTVDKWLRRFRLEGESGLVDRPSRPRSSPRRLPVERIQRILDLRRQRRCGRQIAHIVGCSPATVSRVLCRHRLNRMRDLEPPPPVQRYEHPAPGDLLHLDIKKLGRFLQPGHRTTADKSVCSRGAGWEFVHVAVDDHSRLAFAQILPDERAVSAVAFFEAAVDYYRSLGVTIRRLLTDNGSCYRSHAFRAACRRLGIGHRFTRPYTPRTNGKAERFIQTALREWAYARAYQNSDQRHAHLNPWLHDCNWHRPHASLAYLPPFSRLPALNNLLRLHN